MEKLAFNPDTIYLMTDQPTTCSICGSRCEDIADFWHTHAEWLVMQCLNEDCQFIFLSGDED